MHSEAMPNSLAGNGYAVMIIMKICNIKEEFGS